MLGGLFYHFLSLSLCWGLYMSLYFRPNLDSWHQGLSENIWFEGSLSSDGSVTAYIYELRKNCCGWTGEIEGSTYFYIFLGPKNIFSQMKATHRKIGQYVFVISDYAFIHVMFDWQLDRNLQTEKICINGFRHPNCESQCNQCWNFPLNPCICRRRCIDILNLPSIIKDFPICFGAL